MDQCSLLEAQLQSGQQLVEQFMADGHSVQAAFWARTSDDENWFLYIVTELVDQLGSLETYRTVRSALEKLGPSWLALSEVKVISPAEPMSQDVISIIKQRNSPLPTRIGSRVLGRIGVDQAYLYPYALVQSSHSTAP